MSINDIMESYNNTAVGHNINNTTDYTTRTLQGRMEELEAIAEAWGFDDIPIAVDEECYYFEDGTIFNHCTEEWE